MNKVVLVGRLTKGVEVKQTSSQIAYAYLTIAVDRKYKDANGTRQTDFISCVAWRQTATFIGQYFKKGSKIGISGSIQTRKVDENGVTRYITEVVVEDAEFVESKNQAASTPTPVSVPIAPPMPTTPKENVKIEDMAEYGNLPFEI